MPLSGAHNLNAIHKTAFSSSVGTTPVTAYMNAPVKGAIRKVTGILRGAITTADGLITINNVTTGGVVGTFAVTQSGSAAGQIFSLVPTYTNSLVSEDDVLSIVPSLASGATIGMDFSVSFRTF
jgi:uracil phosphoribosyltransferase